MSIFISKNDRRGRSNPTHKTRRYLVGKRFMRLLLAAAVVAFGTTGLATSPALATNEGNTCLECTHMTNNENWVKNVESYNFSGLGTCDYLWYKNGGTWEKIINKCNGSTYGQLWCYPIELISHGETVRYYKEFTYELYNRQDNFAGCE